MRPSDPVRIGDHVIAGIRCFVVAELGNNHNGDVVLAKKLIRLAASAGADAVKLQKRDVDSLLAPVARDAPYTGGNAFGKTYGAHRRRLELPMSDWKTLQALATDLGLVFFGSAWDKRSVDFLEALGVPCHKIPSACLSDHSLLDYVAQKGKPLILSTGMHDMRELGEAVRVVRRHHTPFVLLHCCSAYPAPLKELNLDAMMTLQTLFPNVPVGYSGHETQLAPTLAAVAMGAEVIERHLTLDKRMRGSDHAASLSGGEFRALVDAVREIEASRGDGIKRCMPSEFAAKAKLAKSVVVTCDLVAGQTVLPEHVAVREPGTGLPSGQMANAVGAVVRRPVVAGTVVEPSLLKRRPLWWRAVQAPALVRGHHRLLARLNPRGIAALEALRLTWRSLRPRRP